MMKRLFNVNGKPFLSVGGQVCNSSSQSEAEMQPGWKAAEVLGLNTVAAPVYWELVEPEEGVFDFSQPDMLLAGAREHGMKLVILWFGTWKNGASQYTPGWVKADGERFVFTRSKGGAVSRTLSPHCRRTLEADKRAYTKLVAHLKEAGAEDVLLGIQVENEPGLLCSPRDYSELGERAYRDAVPENVIGWLRGGACGYLADAWKKNGAKETGNWEDLFGFDGPEACSAWAVASYINEVSAAGKEIADYPTYINTWLGEMYNRVPGVDYPSGGCTSHVIDLWKFLTPDIDALSPDVYFPDDRTYTKVAQTYSREDNIFYIPESGTNKWNVMNTLNAMKDYRLSGIHVFGIERAIDENGALKPEAREYKGMVSALLSMRHLIEEYQDTDKFYVITQYDAQSSQYLDFGDWTGRAAFYMSNGDGRWEKPRNTDYKHKTEETFGHQAKGVIIYLGNGEFYLAGEGFSLDLIRKKDIEEMAGGVFASRFRNGRHLPFYRIEEGSFDENGCYIVKKIRTGDESDEGIWMAEDAGVVHLLLEC